MGSFLGYVLLGSLYFIFRLLIREYGSSKDFVNWEWIGHILYRSDQLFGLFDLNSIRYSIH